MLERWIVRSSSILMAFASLFLFFAIMAFVVAKPSYTWDSVAYAAIALTWQGEPDVSAHSSAYDIILSATDDPERVVDSGNSWRELMQNNSQAFTAQIPFYSLKPLYPSLLSALGVAGVSIPTAMLIVRILAFLLLLVATFFLLSEAIGRRLETGLLSLLFLSTPAFLPILKWSGPDALSLSIVMTGTYFFIRNRRRLALLAFMVSVLARPDNAIFCVLIYCGGMYLYREKVRENVLAAIAIVGTYVFTAAYFGGYGWTTLMYHSFIERVARPDLVEVSITASQLISVYLYHVLSMIRETYWTVFLCLWFLAFLLDVRTSRTLGRNKVLLLVALANLIIHFLAFPEVHDRFYTPSYILIFAVFVDVVFSNRHARVIGVR